MADVMPAPPAVESWILPPLRRQRLVASGQEEMAQEFLANPEPEPSAEEASELIGGSSRRRKTY